MKNKLVDLNNHLFAQIERLGDEGLNGEALTTEIERSKAMTSVAHAIIDNAQLVLDASVAVREIGVNKIPMLEGTKDK